MSAPWDRHLAPELRGAPPELSPQGTLVHRWLHRWRTRGDAPALRDIDGTWLSASELEERTARTAAGLLAQGHERGDRLLLRGTVSAAWVCAYIAALRAGLVVVPVNPDYTEGELARIERAAAPAITAAGDHELPRAAGAREVDSVLAGDGALLLFTSGTTGRPKGALLSHANLLAGATAVELAWRWTPDDVLLLALPLFHLHGLGVGINGSLCAGGAVVLRPRFEAADVAAQLTGTAPPTLFFGVPAMYQRLAASGHAGALAGLRLLVSGSAPLPAALAQQIAADAGQMPLERYGMTETVMLTSNPYEGARRPGTVGFPLPGVQLRLADDGEVQVTGPSVIDSYLDDTGASAEAFTPDGWFRTGDLGSISEDGYLTLAGRSKELIITGGLNVHPREVEEALALHPAVAEIAVVGRPSEAWGEEVTAVVVPVAAATVTADELRAYAAQRLAPYKVPKRVEFAAELPRNALGKLLRGELRGSP